jgi:hypothetical protein
LLAHLDEPPGVSAVPSADDDHRFHRASQRSRRVLAVAGRVANRVVNDELLAPREHQRHELVQLGKLLSRLHDDARFREGKE